MNNPQREILELEAELLKLTALVRERRQELERLRRCPHKTCKCRLVWNQQIDKNLASQMRRIRQQLGRRTTSAGKSKSPGRLKSVP